MKDEKNTEMLWEMLNWWLEEAATPEQLIQFGLHFYGPRRVVDKFFSQSVASMAQKEIHRMSLRKRLSGVTPVMKGKK